MAAHCKTSSDHPHKGHQATKLSQLGRNCTKTFDSPGHRKLRSLHELQATCTKCRDPISRACLMMSVYPSSPRSSPEGCDGSGEQTLTRNTTNRQGICQSQIDGALYAVTKNVGCSLFCMHESFRILHERWRWGISLCNNYSENRSFYAYLRKESRLQGQAYLRLSLRTHI